MFYDKGLALKEIVEGSNPVIRGDGGGSQLGGTVGDIESMPFIEAFRQFQFKVKRENFCNIHVSLIPQVRCIIVMFV